MSVARIPFTSAEEGVLSQLAGWMLFIAIVHFIGAAFALFGSCIILGTGVLGAGAASQLGGAQMGLAMIVVAVLVAVAAIVLLYQGVLLVQARSRFQAVVRTDEADQANLSAGFGKLKLFFAIEVVLGVLGLVSNAGQIVVQIVGAL